MSSPTPTIADENRASADAFRAGAGFVASGEVTKRVARPFALPWTLAMIFVGLATLSACVLVPLREENRQLAHELASLQAESEFVRAQAHANAAFVEKVHTDPALAERLVMRATRRPAAGKQFLDLEQAGSFSSSPYALTKLAPPPPRAEYHSDLPGPVVGLLNSSRSRVVLIGAAVFLVGAAVILGGLGNAYGAMLGALVIGIVSQLSTLWFPSSLQNMWALLIMILVLLLRPQGILGRRERVG